jgi:hydrogenase expression/formation protein HypE
MANEGKMIAVVAEEDADKALEAMRQTEHGKHAAVIGTVTEDANVQLVTGLGGVRVLDVLYGEGLPRIC